MPSEIPPHGRTRPSRRLIVNADDLGLTTPITDAILASYEVGIVTSTSLMTNLPGASTASKRALAVPGLAIGVHLNLTTGRPLSPGRGASLVGEDGAFPGKAELRDRSRRGAIDPNDVLEELRAQTRRAIELGIQPTHLDGHNGIDRLPAVETAAIEIAREFGIRAIRTHFGYARPRVGAALGDRVRCAIRNARDCGNITRAWQSRNQFHRSGLRACDGQLRHMRIYPGHSSRTEDLRARLAHLDAGTWELIVHPAPRDDGTATAFAETRQADLDLVRDPGIRETLDKEGIELISYRDL